MTSRRTLLILFMLIYAASFLDRQILAILLPQIRSEFHLSDTALGLLAGPAFAIVYTLLGIPLAVLADRGARRLIVTASLVVFSTMTMLCGAAGNFLVLLGARFGTGVGEAGTGPAISALIAQAWPERQRATALSFYSAGANLGILLAFFGGGLLVEHVGWRLAFVAAGVPGLLLAAAFAVMAPTAADAAPSESSRAGFAATARWLWAQPRFRLIALGAGLASIAGYSGLAFVPSYLTRSHHMQPAAIGLALAFSSGAVGFIGTASAGVLADRIERRTPGRGLIIAVAGLVFMMPFQLLFYLSNDLALVLVALPVLSLGATCFLGPSLAAVQDLAPAAMRAQATALLLAILNLTGLALGPQLTGIVSDLLKPQFGEDALRYALLTGFIPYAAAAWCFHRATCATALHEHIETRAI